MTQEQRHHILNGAICIQTLVRLLRCSAGRHDQHDLIEEIRLQAERIEQAVKTDDMQWPMISSSGTC